VMAMFLLNAAAIPVAIANGRPAEFGTHHDPHHVSGQWIGSGTVISVPIAPLVALAVFRRPHCSDGDAGDLASHWLTRLFSWG
jgi:hypothetical protein